MRAVRSSRTRLLGTLTALALSVALTACGSNESEAGDGSAGAAASSSSASVDPSEPATEESTPADESAQDEGEQDEGEHVDPAEFVKRLQAGIDSTKYAHIDFTMGGAGGEMKGSGDVDYTAKPPDMEMSMKIGPATVGMLLVDEVMFVKSSQAGKKYLEYDLNDPANPLGSGLSDQLDPAASIETFTKAVSSVTSTGSEDVDGRELDRYVLTVDTAKLTDAAPPGLPAEMQIVVWLDDQDRMAKTSMDMGAVQYDATLSAFDKAVQLQAPPDDQVLKPPSS